MLLRFKSSKIHNIFVIVVLLYEMILEIKTKTFVENNILHIFFGFCLVILANPKIKIAIYKKSVLVFTDRIKQSQK